VYVDGAKLASVGLRIRRGASYHGLALNVSTDLEPFSRINVCGHRGLAVTRLADLGGERDVNAAALALLPFLCTALALWPVHDTALAGEAAPIGDAPRAAGQPAAAAAHSAINTELQAVSSR
jgi:lipoate-protein ligase B